VGGVSEVAIKRAARNDGWVSDLASTEELGALVDRIEAHRRELGRDGLPFSYIGSANDAFDVDGYKRVEEAGITDLLTMPWVFYSGFTDVLQEKVDGIYRFADDILSKMEV
jgi:hypothetical protein